MSIIDRTKSAVLTLCALPVASVFGSCASLAQTVQNEGVAERARPDYDPIGIDVGGFRLLPSVTATVEATDNYLATNTNKRSDVYMTVRPEVTLRSNWSRHRLESRTFVSPSVHANLSRENVTQFGTGLNGVFDASRDTSFRGNLGAARYAESRSSFGAFRGNSEPVQYDLFRGGLGVSHSIADLTLSATADAERRNYDDIRQNGAVLIDQDFRDVRTLSVGGSARYALRNGIGLIGSAQYDRARFDLRPGKPGFINGTTLNRNSSGFSVLGGVTLELTSLVFGTVQLGYRKRNYADPRLSTSSGLSYSADVLWNVTQLTSLRFRAAQTYEDSSALQLAGNTRNDFRILADHELYRYVIISADAGFSKFSPDGPGIGGREYNFGVGGRYLINRRFSLTGGLRYASRDSSSPLLRYKAATANVGVRFAL